MNKNNYTGTTVMSRYENADVEQLRGDLKVHTKEFLRAFSRDRSTGMILSGPYGVGKTHAAASILNRIKQRTSYVDGVMISAPDVYDMYYDITRKDHFDRYREQYWYETLNSVPILVFNDLGKENRTGGYSDQVIYCFGRLIRGRVESKRSTIFTTNLSLDESAPNSLKAAYGDAIYSLLWEAAPLRFEITGDDLRACLDGTLEIDPRVQSKSEARLS